MQEKFFKDLRCPKCGQALNISSLTEQQGNEIITASLHCKQCEVDYPITDGVGRFVPVDNYAASFGMQWHTFSNTQLDSVNHTGLSAKRFFRESFWKKDLTGQKILEAGCGMGRFTEVALATGADCYSFDYSSAVEVARINTNQDSRACFSQASIYEMPFPKEFFDKIFCFGVLQHTPNVKQAFMSLLPYLKPGGSIVVDFYAAPITWFVPRQILRPITKRMDRKKLYQLVQNQVPTLLKISDAMAAVPKIGYILKHAVPVANYHGRYPELNEQQIKEWAILDTFDWFSPRYEKPQLAPVIRRWFNQAGLKDIALERIVGLYVARGKKST